MFDLERSLYLKSDKYSIYFCRNDERDEAMKQLIKLTREGTFGLWDEHFKTILLILLETLGDIDVSVKINKILYNMTRSSP
jgi:CLIP-associating protein 1/2